MHIEKPEGKEYGEVSACEQAAAAVWCGVMSECVYVVVVVVDLSSLTAPRA